MFKISGWPNFMAVLIVDSISWRCFDTLDFNPGSWLFCLASTACLTSSFAFFHWSRRLRNKSENWVKREAKTSFWIYLSRGCHTVLITSYSSALIGSAGLELGKGDCSSVSSSEYSESLSGCDSDTIEGLGESLSPWREGLPVVSALGLDLARAFCSNLSIFAIES